MASPTAPGITNVIVGTAGHIDHGKSSLVQRLTGIDPDRLQEEKERGMTIDLGFARYQSSADRLVGIIDVPGHERFIKNMVAGATSVDIVVLVVAADDGVMPQTREHLEILTLLGLSQGLVAVTKADLVDPELLELAIADVQSLLEGTFLEDAPLFPVSNITGEGMEALKAALDERIGQTPVKAADGLFRMPIQRIFSAKGHGTVVTGVPVGGAVSIGDEVEILPLGARGRVRGIQAYGSGRDTASAGHSAALNLTDIDYREVQRGMVAATPGYFRPARLLEARLKYLDGRRQPLEHRTEVRFHVGTSEIMGRVRIVDREHLAPGDEALVQIELEEDVVVKAGDRFLVRQPSPMVTLGGGVLFGPARHHRKRLKEFHIEALQTREDALGSPEESARFAAEARRFEPFTMHELCVDLAMDEESGSGLLQGLVVQGTLVPTGRERYLSKSFADQARTALRKALQDLHAAHPLRKVLEVRTLRGKVDLPESVVNGILAVLIEQGAVKEERPGEVRLSSHVPAIDEEDERILLEVRAALATAGCAPPGLDAMAQSLGAPVERVRKLVELLGDEGEVHRIGKLHFHAPALKTARQALIANARAHEGQVDIPKLRDELGTSRKYMIPILEYFDSTGITVRRGDRRLLREHQVKDESS